MAPEPNRPGPPAVGTGDLWACSQKPFQALMLSCLRRSKGGSHHSAARSYLQLRFGIHPPNAIPIVKARTEMRPQLIATLVLACSTLAGSAQVTSQRSDTSARANDALRSMLSSRTFTLQEDYQGDWGGHLQTFIFTAGETRVRVQWKDPVSGKDLDVFLPLNELERLADLFHECSSRIDNSNTKSTEHITYLFKNNKSTYVLDDHFTMECNAAFHAWKGMLLDEWTKAGNK